MLRGCLETAFDGGKENTMNSDFRKRLLKGDVLVGSLITIPSP